MSRVDNMESTCPPEGKKGKCKENASLFYHRYQNLLINIMVYPLIVMFNLEQQIDALSGNIKQQMLGNLVMIGGIGLLSVGFVFRRKEAHFKDLYDQIERAKKFHMDFVDELAKLPVDQNLILFGPPKSQTNKQKILFTSIIKRGPIQQSQTQNEQKKQFTLPKQDRLWKFSLKQPFYMETLSNEKIIVEEDQSSQLYAFNLMRRNSNEKYQERVIVKNEPVCAYGKILSSGGKIKFKTSLIMGTKNQNFLTYLDQEIIKLRSRGKFLTLAGTSIFALHILYKQFFDSKDKPSKISSLAQSAQEENIIAEIKSFENNSKK